MERTQLDQTRASAAPVRRRSAKAPDSPTIRESLSQLAVSKSRQQASRQWTPTCSNHKATRSWVGSSCCLVRKLYGMSRDQKDLTSSCAYGSQRCSSVSHFNCSAEDASQHADHSRWRSRSLRLFAFRRGRAAKQGEPRVAVDRRTPACL